MIEASDLISWIRQHGGKRVQSLRAETTRRLNLLIMPLSTAEDSSDATGLTKVSQRFIIFYSSIVDGQLWCPVHDVHNAL